MAALDWARIVHLVVGLTVTGNRVSIGMYYAADSTISGDDNEDFVDAWLLANTTILLDCLSQECKFEYVSSHGVMANNVRPVVKYQSGQVGTIAEEALPMNVGAILQFRQTEVSGRHNGRIVLPGIPETATTDGLITTAFATTELEALAAALETPISAGGKTWTLCVLVKELSGVPNIPPDGYAVTNVVPTRNMGTQRRRTTELREFHP